MWYTHFYNLFGKDPEELAKILDGLQIEDEDFTKQDTERAISKLKEGKTSHQKH